MCDEVYAFGSGLLGLLNSRAYDLLSELANGPSSEFVTPVDRRITRFFQRSIHPRHRYGRATKAMQNDNGFAGKGHQV